MNCETGSADSLWICPELMKIYPDHYYSVMDPAQSVFNFMLRSSRH